MYNVAGIFHETEANLDSVDCKPSISNVLTKLAKWLKMVDGGMKKQHVQLTSADREHLETLIRKGQQTAKAYRRALSLLELDRGQTYTAVSKTLQVTIPTLSNWAALYKEKGLKVLEDKPRSGHPIEIDGEQRAKITALACSDPPEGYAQSSLRLLANKVVELGYCEHISHTEVADILKKTN